MENLFETMIYIFSCIEKNYGGIGLTLGYIVLLSPFISAIIEIFDLSCHLLVFKKGDEIADRIKAVWNTWVLPVLEIFPRFNIPVATWVTRIIWLSKITLKFIQKKKEEKKD